MSDFKEDTRRTPKYGYGFKQEPWNIFQVQPRDIPKYVPATVDSDQVSVYIRTWHGRMYFNESYDYLVPNSDEYYEELCKRKELAILLNKLLTYCDNAWLNSYSNSKKEFKRFTQYGRQFNKSHEKYDITHIDFLLNNCKFYKQLDKMINDTCWDGKKYQKKSAKCLIMSHLSMFGDIEWTKSFIRDYVALHDVITERQMEYYKNRGYSSKLNFSKDRSIEHKHQIRSKRRELQIMCNKMLFQ